MNALRKTFIRICIGIILFGIVLIIIAYCMGISQSDIPTRMRMRDYFTKTVDKVVTETAETIVENEATNQIVTEKIIENVQVEQEEITSISIDMNVGKLTVNDGNDFTIKGKNLEQSEFYDYVDNGEWIISNYTDVWNIPKLSRKGRHSSFNKTPELIITIPKDFIAEYFSITIGAGKATLETARAKNVNLSVEAGELIVQQLEAKENCDFQVEAGNLEIKNGNVINTDMSCNVGQLKFSGELADISNIECNVGNIELKLKGKQEDYNYSIDCGVGQIKINQDTYNLENSVYIENNANSEKELILNNGVGKIDVQIN